MEEILECIRKHVPIWKNKDDEYMTQYCGLIPQVEELIGNKGFSIEQAVLSLL